MTRTTLLLAAALALPSALLSSRADAQAALLVLGDDARLDGLASTLQVELAGEGWQVAQGPSPVGGTPLQRAGDAQQCAAERGARAALWVETGPEGGALLQVVDVDGSAPRHAPLPAPLDAVEARTFATVAASLLDELAAPPQSLRVRVQVAVEAEDGSRFVVEEGSASVRAGERSATVELGAEAEGAPPTEAPPVDELSAEPPREPLPPPAALQGDAAPLASPAASPVSPAAAPPSDGPHVVVGVDFAPFVGMSSAPWGRGRRNLSVGLLAAWSSEVHGVGLSGGANFVTERLDGALLGGGANFLFGDGAGVLAAGGLNLQRGDLVGAALSGGANLHLGHVEGVQAAGGLNWAESVTGAQLAGGVNIARGRVDGVQAAGGLNVARGGRGLQIAPLNIQRERFDGVQVGVVNVSKGADFALGLVNIVQGGRTHLELSATAEGFAFAMVKHGGAHWHYLYSLGGRPFSNGDDDAAWAFGLGIGAHATLTERWFLDVDLLAHYLHDGEGTDELTNEIGHEALSQLRLVAGVEVLPRVALVAGLSLNVLTAYEDDSRYAPWAVDLRDHVPAEELDLREDWSVHIWPSVLLGVQFF